MARRKLPQAVASESPAPEPRLTFIQAMESPELFGRWFQAPSWDVWKDVARAMDGAAPRDIERFHEIAGSRDFPAEPCRELWCVCGRRAGKSIFSAARAAFEAVYRDYSPYLKPGELGVVMLVAADRDQAQVLFRYVEAMFDETPVLAALVTGRTKDSLELSNGIAISVQTCNFRRIRGRTVVCCICDEAALWISDLDSRNADREVLAAIRPSMATIPNARLIVISSPWAKRGIVWDAFKQWHGQNVPGILVIRAATSTMNPTIDQAFLAAEREKDPVAYRAEFDAFFRDDLETFVSVEAVEAVVVRGRGRLPYRAGRPFYAFIDTAGGTGGSSVALVITTRGNGKIVVMSIDEWVPPFDPEQVAALVAQRLREYGLSGCTGDHYSGGTWPSILKTHGIRYVYSKRNKSQLLHDFLPLVTARLVELPDHKRMINQVLALERSTSKHDLDSIGAPPGGHDDVINATAGAVLMAQKPRALEGHGQEAPVASPPTDPQVIREEVRRVNGQPVIYRIFPDGREVMDRLGDQVRAPQPFIQDRFCRQCMTKRQEPDFTCPAGGPDHTWCAKCGEGHEWCPKERA